MTVDNHIHSPTLAFMNGEFRESASGERMPTLNPATGETIVEVAACGSRDVDFAVETARAAFESGFWSRSSPVERKIVLLRLADLIENASEELALLDTLEAGKPISDCRGVDIPDVVRTFRWYAEAIDKVFGSIAPTGEDALALVIREPVGVVAAVLPWNFPLLMLAWKAAPALAAGNSIIIKPAEQSSLSALRFCELIAEAGIPEGIFSVLPGFGETAGQALGRHPDIDAISFTGSTEVGRLFLRYSAESNLKRVTLECGGKSPQIVLQDAPDLKLVAAEVATAGYWNMGENCTAGARLLVHESLEDELTSLVVENSLEWQVGDPLREETRIGPLIEQNHLEKVQAYVDSALTEGATIVAGGTPALPESGGYFFNPTIISDVQSHMRVAREEIFGPVISIMRFADLDEACRIANETTYGLAASVWTTNIDTALKASRAVRAGTISVNCYSEGDVATPFGGYKESGFGGRDKGLEAFDQYTEIKTIWIAVR